MEKGFLKGKSSSKKIYDICQNDVLGGAGRPEALLFCCVPALPRVLDGLMLEAHDVVLDLGCGDGRWLIAAAIRGCVGRGYDLNSELLEKGRRAAAEAGVSCVMSSL